MTLSIKYNVNKHNNTHCKETQHDDTQYSVIQRNDAQYNDT